MEIKHMDVRFELRPGAALYWADRAPKRVERDVGIGSRRNLYAVPHEQTRTLAISDGCATAV